jgi:hypothetical protein
MAAVRPVRRTADERDNDADDLDEAARMRDLAAQDRDDDATARDRAASERDDAVRERDMTIRGQLRAGSAWSTAAGTQAADIASRAPDGTRADGAQAPGLWEELTRICQDAADDRQAAAGDREAAWTLLKTPGRGAGSAGRLPRPPGRGG